MKSNLNIFSTSHHIPPWLSSSPISLFPSIWSPSSSSDLTSSSSSSSGNRSIPSLSSFRPIFEYPPSLPLYVTHSRIYVSRSHDDGMMPPGDSWNCHEDFMSVHNTDYDQHMGIPHIRFHWYCFGSSRRFQWYTTCPLSIRWWGHLSSSSAAILIHIHTVHCLNNRNPDHKSPLICHTTNNKKKGKQPKRQCQLE